MQPKSLTESRMGWLVKGIATYLAEGGRSQTGHWVKLFETGLVSSSACQVYKTVNDRRLLFARFLA